VDPLVILGCGFVGLEVARLGLSNGANVIGTTRGAPRDGVIPTPGFEMRVVPVLTRDVVRSLVAPGRRVLVAFPPDGQTDAEIAPALAGARVVYLSTTGVYGGARGRIDESTDVDSSEPRAALRLAAERAYLDRGATVLRAAGIYGPGRGLHRRLLGGDFRIPGAGANVVSRIHVTDLARMTLALLDWPDRAPGGAVFVVADDAPVPQIEAIRWLCQRLHLPLPPEAPIAEVAPTLRHDRAVDNTRIKRALSLSLLFPSYREGFEACLTAEGVNRPDFFSRPEETPQDSRRRGE
jgi:nucleoside-diphosphate-sugar epimerase